MFIVRKDTLGWCAGLGLALAMSVGCERTECMTAMISCSDDGAHILECDQGKWVIKEFCGVGTACGENTVSSEDDHSSHEDPVNLYACLTEDHSAHAGGAHAGGSYGGAHAGGAHAGGSYGGAHAGGASGGHTGGASGGHIGGTGAGMTGGAE